MIAICGDVGGIIRLSGGHEHLGGCAWEQMIWEKAGGGWWNGTCRFEAQLQGESSREVDRYGREGAGKYECIIMLWTDL
jgi:hypothetical protein